MDHLPGSLSSQPLVTASHIILDELSYFLLPRPSVSSPLAVYTWLAAENGEPSQSGVLVHKFVLRGRIGVSARSPNHRDNGAVLFGGTHRSNGCCVNEYRMTGIYRGFTRAVRFAFTPFSRIGHSRLRCPSRRRTQPRFSLRINPDLIRRDSRVKPERRRSERFPSRIAMVFDFACSLHPVHPPTSSTSGRVFFFNFWKGGKKGDTYVRTYVHTLGEEQ